MEYKSIFVTLGARVLAKIVKALMKVKVKHLLAALRVEEKVSQQIICKNLRFSLLSS